MEIIPKQKIFVFIYLTGIDNFLITTPAIIFYKKQYVAEFYKGWPDFWTQKHFLAMLDILTVVKSKFTIEKKLIWKYNSMRDGYKRNKSRLFFGLTMIYL